MHNDLVSLSVELAKAHLMQNRMSFRDVPGFVRDIHEVLSQLDRAGSAASPVSAGAAATPPRAAANSRTTAPANAASAELTASEVAIETAPETAAEISTGSVSRVAPILNEDISDAAFKGLDPWLAKRITTKMASKLDPKNKIHPTVYPDDIICLEDGQKVRLLRPYVQKRFGLAFNDYIDKWNLPDDYPTAPPKYLEAKRAAAKASGLGVTTRARRESKAVAAPAKTRRAARTTTPRADAVPERKGNPSTATQPGAGGRGRRREAQILT